MHSGPEAEAGDHRRLGPLPFSSIFAVSKHCCRRCVVGMLALFKSRPQRTNGPCAASRALRALVSCNGISYNMVVMVGTHAGWAMFLQSPISAVCPDLKQLKACNPCCQVGDNPASDVRGANRAGPPWVPVLVRTGVFSGPPGSNSETDPAQVITSHRVSQLIRPAQQAMVHGGQVVCGKQTAVCASNAIGTQTVT